MQGQRGPIGFSGPHGDKGDRVRLKTSSSEADEERARGMLTEHYPRV